MSANKSKQKQKNLSAENPKDLIFLFPSSTLWAFSWLFKTHVHVVHLLYGFRIDFELNEDETENNFLLDFHCYK